LIRFDQRQVDVWGPDFQGQGGESGAGADVQDVNMPAQAELGRGTLQSLDGLALGKEVVSEEEGLAEVAGYDFFFFADGSEIDAGIPAF